MAFHLLGNIGAEILNPFALQNASLKLEFVEYTSPERMFPVEID